MKLLHSTIYVQNLTPTSRDIYGNKRSLTGYNVYLRYFFLHFKLLTDDNQRELLCDTGIHTEETYILSDEDSVISLPEVTTVGIIKVAAIEWSKIELETKRAWRELATMISNLPILGGFKTVPEIVTEEEIKTALSTIINSSILYRI